MVLGWDDAEVNAWDFGQWRNDLEGAGVDGAALIGLGAAQRVSGCLSDPRFARYEDTGARLANDLLDECWAIAYNEEGRGWNRVEALAERLDAYATGYMQRSMTEWFHSMRHPGPDDPVGEGDLAEFLEEALPEGAVLLHFCAMEALTHVADVWRRSHWDGALRCLQTAGMMSTRSDGSEIAGLADLPRQIADLKTIRAAGKNLHREIVDELRESAVSGSSIWLAAAERAELFSD